MGRSPKTRISLCLAFCAGLGLASAKCYNLDGSEATRDVPCRANGTSNCCSIGDVCLSNGLCYLQGNRANALSRGSCTDKNWGPACFAPCSNTMRNSGFPIINMGYAGDDSKYCCGPVVINNSSLGCKVGDPFQIDKGSVLLGVAALAGYSNSTSTSTSTSNNCTPADDSSDKDCPTAEPSTSHDVAIGAGVGVPLGVIALASIVWALWERRQRKQALQSISAPVAVGHPNIGYNPSQGVYRRPPVELSTAPVSELDGSGNGEMK